MESQNDPRQMSADEFATRLVFDGVFRDATAVTTVAPAEYAAVAAAIAAVEQEHGYKLDRLGEAVDALALEAFAAGVRHGALAADFRRLLPEA